MRQAALLLLVLLAACAAPARRPTPEAAAPAAEPSTSRAADPLAPPAPDPVPNPASGEPEPSPVEPDDTPEHGAAIKVPDRAGPYDRLADALGDPNCEGDRRVQRWIALYGGKRAQFEATLAQSQPLLDYVLREIEARELPAQFALLPMIESTFQPLAGRRGGAFGLWQLMPPTARSLGLRVDSEFDARLAPAEATRAALDYLERMHTHFEDWRLTALGFNAGEYRIRASLKNGNGEVSAHAQQPPGLSPISYDYIAKLKALSCLIAESERFGIELPNGDFEPLVAVRAPEGIRHLWDLADAADLTPERLRNLNPALSGMVLPPGQQPVLLLPASAAERLQGLAQDPQRLAALRSAPPRGHEVRNGDTLYAIARRNGIALRDLLRWNGLREDAVIRPGQWLRLQPAP